MDNRDTQTVSLTDSGNEILKHLQPGTIIGDCEIRQVKLYSRIEFIIVVRKTNGNILTSKFNPDQNLSLKNPSWHTETEDEINIKNISRFEMFNTQKLYELDIKIKKFNNGATKAVGLRMRTSEINGK